MVRSKLRRGSPPLQAQGKEGARHGYASEERPPAQNRRIHPSTSRNRTARISEADIMKDTYVFPAIFHDDPDGISITFPDLPGCLPCADSMEEAFRNAKEALQLHLFGMEEDNEEIPLPSRVSELHCEENESIAMIEAWMPPFRERMANKAMNKTVTIPRWLDILARRQKVNYSHLLQDALKQYLGVQENPVLYTAK